MTREPAIGRPIGDRRSGAELGPHEGVVAGVVDRDAASLLARMREIGPCLVAYSGGVDSAVVARAAAFVWGTEAMAVMALSASVSEHERREATTTARRIGVALTFVDTDEVADPRYARNDSDRCYFCKSHLHDRLTDVAAESAPRVVVDGTNADDALDHRPGRRAAAERGVRSPLAECGLSKERVRELARYWDVPVWNKPASPCLASRIAYGEEVTPDRLRRVERAEQVLRELGLEDLRVRLHAGELARIEVPLEAVPRLAMDPIRERLVVALREIGFRFVTLDLAGLKSGSLNQLIGITIPDALRHDS